jgi:hypothetical protein
LWETRVDQPDPPVHKTGPGPSHAAVVWDLPGATGRYLLATSVAVPDGAAVVQDGLCLGTARGLAFGLALVTSFPASRHTWSLCLLPSVAGERPLELTGRVVSGRQGHAVVEFTADRFDAEALAMPSGYLFTGSNGSDCPAGLLLGSARPVPGYLNRLRVTLPVMRGPRAAEVTVSEGVW